ncbi:GW dipeptide domain-containing protein, partial [Pisciglobus halotolerans]
MKQKNQKKVTILTVVLLFSSNFSPLLVYAEGQNAPSESQTSSSLIEENVKQEETQGEIIHNKTSDSTDLEEPEIPLEGSEVEEEGELEENTEEKSNESSSQDSIEADSNSESDAAKESEVKVIEEKVIQYAIRIKDSKLPIYSEKSSVEKPEKVSESDDYLNKLLYVEKEVLTNKDTWVLISLDGQVIGWINKEGTEEIDEPTVFSSKKEKTIVPSVFYSTHVQSKGWMPEVKDGVLSGTEGQKKRMEAIKINLSDVKGLGVKYSTHVQSYGWMDWVSDGKLSGTSNQAKRMEAIKIQLTGENAKNYDIYYRVHAESYGWLGWAKNGAEAGTSGLAKRLEAIQIVLVKKGEKAPGSTERPYIQKTV